MTYIKPEMVCNSVATSGFVAVSTKPIPGVTPTDTTAVLNKVDCCLMIHGYTPGNATANTGKILDSLVNVGCINQINRDGECTGGCWLSNNIRSIKIVKVNNGYYYQEFTGSNCVNQQSSGHGPGRP